MKIVLSMIVKNENDIINDLLKSVKNIIDYWVIVDTGSTDDTINTIKKTMKSIPGEVVKRPWINFGHNRTEGLELARNKGDYILCLDADMILVDNGFDKSQLKHDGYYVWQKERDSNLEYYNLRLLSTALIWKSIGVTHEHYACEKTPNIAKLGTLRIDDVGNGGCKQDKFQRDIVLLTKGLEDEPNNERYMFYLANSHKSVGQYDKAIFWYEKRIKVGGWVEEIYESMHQMVLCKFLAGRPFVRVLEDVIRCSRLNRDRLEAVYYLLKHCRTNQKYYQIGYELGRYVFERGIKAPDDVILFMDKTIYEWKFCDELSIISYYAGDKEFGKKCLNSLSNVPQSEMGRIAKNAQFFEGC